MSNQNWLDVKIYNFLNEDLQGDWRSYSNRRNKVRNDIIKLHDSGQITSMDLRRVSSSSMTPLHSLPNLVSLNFDHNYLYWQEELAGINKLPNLERLSLRGCRIRSLDTLSENINLRRLILSGNSIENTGPLYSYPNLDTLILSQNEIITLASFPKLDKLVFLNLADNPLTEIRRLGDLPSLKKLILDNMSSNVGSIPRMDQLESLSMRVSPTAVYFGFMPDIFFPGLLSLDLTSNGLYSLDFLSTSDSILCKTPALTYLNLDKNRFYELPGIERFEKLKYLSVSSNKLDTLEGVEKLPNLIHLILDENRLREIDFLENMGQLKKLNLSDNPFIDDFSVLSGLSSLYYLNVSLTMFNDLQIIKSAELLEYLLLENCRIPDWELLMSFPKLGTLHASFIKEEDLKILKEIPLLKYVHLTSTERSVVRLLRKELPGVKITYD